MQRDDDPQLWDLLSQAPRPCVSPFFARNVLRRVRSLTERRIWFSARILVPVAAFAVVLIVAIFVLPVTWQRPADSEDSELVADLDDLFPVDDDALNDVAVL